MSFGVLIEQLYFKKGLTLFTITALFCAELFVRVLSLYKGTKYQTNIIGEVQAKLRTMLITKALSIGPACSEYATSHLITMGSDIIEQLENYYVERLKACLDTFIKELGDTFSGGERQRIGLA